MLKLVKAQRVGTSANTSVVLTAVEGLLFQNTGLDLLSMEGTSSSPIVGSSLIQRM